MLDKLVAHFGGRRHPVKDPSFTYSQSIIDMRLSNPNAERLTVVFPPWNASEKATYVLERRLHRAGSATLTFYLHGQILRPDIQGVIDSFAFVQEQAVQTIEKLFTEHEYGTMDVVGMSIGGLSLALLAQNTKRISRATYVVGGSRLAPCVWEGARTQDLRRAFEDRGIGLPELESAWSSLSPSLNAPALRGKPVQLYVSETDTFVPIKYQDELVAAMRGSGAIVEEHRSRLGHAASIMAYCTKGRL